MGAIENLTRIMGARAQTKSSSARASVIVPPEMTLAIRTQDAHRQQSKYWSAAAALRREVSAYLHHARENRPHRRVTGMGQTTRRHALASEQDEEGRVIGRPDPAEFPLETPALWVAPRRRP